MSCLVSSRFCDETSLLEVWSDDSTGCQIISSLASVFDFLQLYCFHLLLSTVKKKERLFSVVTTDGRMLDFEAPSTQLRAEWVARLRGLIEICGPFVDYHFKIGHYDVFDLLKKERYRLSPENIKRLKDEKRVSASQSAFDY